MSKFLFIAAQLLSSSLRCTKQSFINQGRIGMVRYYHLWMQNETGKETSIPDHNTASMSADEISKEGVFQLLKG